MLQGLQAFKANKGPIRRSTRPSPLAACRHGLACAALFPEKPLKTWPEFVLAKIKPPSTAVICRSTRLRAVSQSATSLRTLRSSSTCSSSTRSGISTGLSVPLLARPSKLELLLEILDYPLPVRKPA